MNSWEVELQALLGFIADEIDDFLTLVRTTPVDVLAGPTAQSLLKQAMFVMDHGSGAVMAHKLLTMPKGK